MRRAIIVSILSFAAGAGASYGLLYQAANVPAREPAALRPSLSGAPSSVADLGVPLALAAPAVAERARVYRAVADARADELETMAREALSRVDRSGRSFELEAVLARLIEIDPGAALAFARDRDLGPDHELDVALSVLDTFGYSEPAIEDILTALPGLDRNRFRMRALERLASVDPAQALGIALADLNDSSATVRPAFAPFGFGGPQVLLRIASVWAGRDPEGALAAIDTIADTQARFMFAQGVFGRVARSDPDAVLAYIDVMNVPEPQKIGLVQTAISQLASQDPERAIRYAEALGGRSGQMAMMMAVQQWAQRDAAAAIAYVEAMPAGMARLSLLQQIASAYGRSDPDAALNWVQSLTSGQAQAYAGVLTGIAQSDPVRALDLAFDDSQHRLPPGMQMQALMSVIGAAAMGAVPHRTLGDRILTLENGQARQNALRMLGETWASADVDGALDWFMNNQESIGPSILGNLARQFGRQDPQSAALYTGRVLPELRGEWISAIASGYAQTDPDGARAWVQQFRGEPVYETAVTEVIRFSAASDPAGAAALWASVDFTNQAQKTQLVSAIAGSWASQDWPAARNWAATLPLGETRDNALTGMIGVRQEIPDASVMSLFSNDDRRLAAIQSVIMQTAQYDPERARAMVAQYFDEPLRREQAEQMIENIESRQSSRPFISPAVQGVMPAIGFRGQFDQVIVR